MAYLNGNMNIMRFVTRENEAPRYKGIFPLAIDSVGGNLSDWTIYGNTEGVGEETENLFNKDAPYTSNKYLNVSGEEVSGSTWGISEFIPIEGNTTYTAYNLSGGGASACWYDENKNFIDGESYGGVATKSFSLPSNAGYIRLTLRIVNPSNVDTLMLIKGTISPSEYIPFGYKIPLDIRSLSDTNEITKSRRADIVETAGATIDVDIQAGTVTINGTTNNAVAEVIIFMDVTEGDYWYSGVPHQEDNSISAKLMNTRYLPPWEFNKWDGSEPGSDIGYGEEAVIDVERVRYHLYFAPNHTYNNLVIKPKVQKATITTHKDIYTGSSPLTEGQSVSRDSTGIEIEVERGQSMIETMLTNKPKMSVVPDSYVKLKQIAMNSNGSYNETQIDYITDNIEEVTQ